MTRHPSTAVPGCTSPKLVIKEAVKSPEYRSIIMAAVGSEPMIPDKHADFRLAQLDPKAAELLPAAFSVTAHPLSARRARRWRERPSLCLSHPIPRRPAAALVRVRISRSHPNPNFDQILD